MPRCWAERLLWLVLAIAGTGAMLGGCGQKGDLYLPEDGSKRAVETETR
ncbi:MAG: lipoprotein [Chromatiales bacterium]|nr:lipoprotein [Chromatiales bacterium]